MTFKDYPSQERLKELFDYQDGNLIRKISTCNRVKVGSVAGSMGATGYLSITVDGVLYLAHRLVWVYFHGVIPENLRIDHINTCRSDNKVENLRLVTHQENAFNTNARGYYFDKSKQKFLSKIGIDGKQIYLGCYKTEQEARDAYLNAKNKYHQITNNILLKNWRS